MQTHKNKIIAGLILIIGLAIGFSVGICASHRHGGSMSEVYEREGRGHMQMGHMMKDGTFMGENGDRNSIGDSMSMQGMMDSMNKDLQGKSGDEFDRAFLSEMIVHHQGAVQMAESALSNAKHQEIKNLAQDIISAQNKEILEMSAWQINWYQASNATNTDTTMQKDSSGKMMHESK